MKMRFNTGILIIALFLMTGRLALSQHKNKNEQTISQSSEGLVNRSDTLQYTLGSYIGQWLVSNGFIISDPVLFSKGLEDVLQNRPREIPDSLIGPMLSDYQLSTQVEKNRQMETRLFESLKGQPGIGMLPNGVHYLVVRQGSGIRPLTTDTVMVNVIGQFPDGKIFEDTYQKKQAVIIPVSGLIPGLAEAIQLMPAGSVWRIFVPSALGYGSNGLQGIIPADMALIFDISLEEVK